MKYKLTEKEKSELLTKKYIEYKDSSGDLHREDGPAIIWADGTQVWWINGNHHREDGPAVIYASGTQVWWINGKRHREDGPAVIYANGTQEWWINGDHVTGKVEEWAKSCDIDLYNISEPDKLLLKMFLNGLQI